jgi:hypothetical protein
MTVVGFEVQNPKLKVQSSRETQSRKQQTASFRNEAHAGVGGLSFP